MAGTTGTASVLFTDLVASTTVRTQLGEQRADVWRHAHDELLARAVTANGGTIVKGLGDGVMATFGSASDAVAAAVAVQQSVHTVNRRSPDVPMQVRIGISSGDVLWEDGDCFGGPVIEASRLCAAADGGQILVADVVRLLARGRDGVHYEPVGPLQLKGISEPVAANEVRWAPPRAGRFPEAPIPDLLDTFSRLGFSGREDELATVLRTYKEALGGTRQAVLVAGEPGIGKTRLAREVAAAARDDGAIVLYGRCEEDLGAPYQPFVEALGFFVERVGAPVDLLGRHPGDLTRICPAVADLHPQLPPALVSDPETERYRLFEAVASWLRTAAEPDGLVLVLDDLHWATRPTLLLLQHVLHATTEARLLVVGTYRDTDLDRRHPLSGLLADLRRVPGTTRLALAGLDLDGVNELVASAAGHDLDDAGLALAAQLHAETEGNPFFIAEILRHLVETGAVYERDGRWVSDRGAADLGIPEGVREVVGRRLDRLSPAANAALAVAAVVGREFDVPTVAAVVGADDVVLVSLDEAAAARLVRETDVGRYRFAHALVRDTLYEELSATRRSRLHHNVARVLEESGSDDVAAMAHHYGQSVGDTAKAVEYAVKAARRAAEQLATHEAVRLFAQALDLLEPADDERRCDVLVELGQAQRWVGDPAHRGTLLDAGRMAQRLGAPDRMARAALGNSRGFWSMVGEVDPDRVDLLRAALEAVGPNDPSLRSRLLVTLSGELMFSDELGSAPALCREAAQLARATGDGRLLAEVLTVSIPSLLTPDSLALAAEFADELDGLLAQVQDPQRRVTALLWGYSVGCISGRAADSVDHRLDEAVRIAEDLGQPSLRWLTSSWCGFRALMQGRVEEAERLAMHSAQLGTEAGEPDAALWFSGQLLGVRRHQGRIGELIDLLEAEVSNPASLPAWRAVYAASLPLAGRPDDATALLDRWLAGELAAPARDVLWLCSMAFLTEAAALTRHEGAAAALYDLLLPYRAQVAHAGVTMLGSIEHHLGTLASVLGRWSDAESHFDVAEQVHRRMRATTWVACTALERATMLARRAASAPPDDPAGAADRERATALARQARETAAPLGLVLVAEQAAAVEAGG